jgi:hypothetical protein
VSNRVASWIWIGALLLGGVVSGCSDDGQDSPSQMASGSSGGASGRSAAGEKASERAGAEAAAGSGGGSGSAGMSSSAAGAPAMDDGMPRWTSIYSFVFWSCRNAGCHGSGLAGVNFATKDGAWESLVGMPANPKFACSELGKQRVVPGEPDNSLLYLKLDINAPCGQQMPPAPALTDAARERVREWIVRGAKND